MKSYFPRIRPTRNILWGLTYGLVFGIIFSIWAVIVSVLQGSLVLEVRGSRIHLLAVIAVYLVGGQAAGFLVGVLKPLTRSKLGASFVGMLAAAPVGFGVMLSISGFPLTSDDFITLAIWSTVFGGAVGLIYHGIFYDEPGDADHKRQ